MQYIMTVNTTGGYLNMRSFAGLNGTIVGKAVNGEYLVDAAENQITVDNYLWRNVTVDGVTGYIALGMANSYNKWVTFEEVVQEEPDIPQTPTQPEWYENFLQQQIILAEDCAEGLMMMVHAYDQYKGYAVDLLDSLTEE